MKKIIIGLIVILTLAAGSHSYAQDEPPPAECEYDLTGETVAFYHFGDLSGPYNFITSPVVRGFDDAIGFYNENGGICGAEIRVEYADTGASGEAAQAAWDDFTGRGDAQVILLYLTEDSELLRDQAAEAEVPIVVAAGSWRSLYGDDADEPGWVFSPTPLYHDQLGAFCRYISENWDDYGLEGEPVIGHVSWLGAFGEASDTDEARAYCESVGVGYAGAHYYFPGIPDITTQVQRVVSAGANIIYTTSLTTGPANLAGIVDALGIRDEVLLAGPNWALDTSVVRLGGLSADGIIGQSPFIWWDEIQHPGVQQVTSYWASKYLSGDSDVSDPLELRNIAYLLSWAMVDWYREFMILGINDAGGLENFSGRHVYDVITSDRTFAPLDGIAEFNFSDGVRSGNRTRVATLQVNSDGSVVIPLTDWVTTPDLRPGGADVPSN